jgi:hypothetical protein
MYTQDAIESDHRLQLSVEGLILIAVLAGGDYDQVSLLLLFYPSTGADLEIIIRLDYATAASSWQMSLHGIHIWVNSLSKCSGHIVTELTNSTIPFNRGAMS